MFTFRVLLNSEESLIIPKLLSIIIKNIKYSIPFKILGTTDNSNFIILNDGINDLGEVIFRNLGIDAFHLLTSHLEVNTLQAYNMIHDKESNSNNDLEINYATAVRLGIRHKERIPVGTLLMEAVKLVAAENNMSIELSSKLNAENFYRKIGMKEIKGCGCGLKRFRTRAPRPSWCDFWCSRKVNKSERIRMRTRMRTRKLLK